MARHVVAERGEIPPGGRRLVTLQGREIGVFNLGGAYFALGNRCPHQGGALCRGALVGLATASEPGRVVLSRAGEVLKCPWHGWEFDIRTGRPVCDPGGTGARAYRVTVQAGATLGPGVLVAGSLAVAAEGEYIVVEL